MLGRRVDGQEAAGIQAHAAGGDDQRAGALVCARRVAEEMRGELRGVDHAAERDVDAAHVRRRRQGLDIVAGALREEIRRLQDAGVGEYKVNPFGLCKDVRECPAH